MQAKCGQIVVAPLCLSVEGISFRNLESLPKSGSEERIILARKFYGMQTMSGLTQEKSISCSHEIAYKYNS